MYSISLFVVCILVDTSEVRYFDNPSRDSVLSLTYHEEVRDYYDINVSMISSEKPARAAHIIPASTEAPKLWRLNADKYKELILFS
jgi:hypothetical protein